MTVTFRIVSVSTSNELEVPLELGLGVAAVVDLNDVRLISVVPQQVEPMLKAVGVEQVAEHDGQPPPLAAMDEAFGHPGQVGRGSLRLEPFQELEQRQDAGLAARQREIGHDVAGERHHRHAVQIGQRDIGQGRRHLPRIVKLGRVAEGHAPRAVEQACRRAGLLLPETA